MRNIITLLLFAMGLTAFAANGKTVTADSTQWEFRYRLALTDKADTPYDIAHPEAFLSQKSIERRHRLGIAIDEYDLPISPDYLKAIRETGTKILNMSKWNNTVLVSLADSTESLRRLEALPFVKSSLLVYSNSAAPLADDDDTDRRAGITDSLPHSTRVDSLYGVAQRQTDMLNMDALHNRGFRGAGITIAVLDGGFHNVDAIAGFKGSRILGTRNFVRPETSVYDEHSHGMMVLACMSPNIPGTIVGTAPDADYYLFVTEDTYFEYRGEEDNWCAAVEYADSLGVDLITSSLGYVRFDTPIESLEYHWLDGAHELNSRTASLCASRGIVLCNSAGNEGEDQWKKIGFPADARDIITVGAVDAEGTNTVFSSIGNTADGRIKPDVMALGGRVAVLATDGSITRVNGTSFSCPIMAGAVACLLQAHPDKRPEAIIEALHKAGANAEHPNNIFGYGIPDMLKAHENLK